MLQCHITPRERREHNYVSLRRKKKSAKFPFVNGDVSEAVDLASVTLDHKVYHVEGIRSILDSISPIYLSKNIFDERFGDKLVVFLYKLQNPLFFDLQRKSRIYKGKCSFSANFG